MNELSAFERRLAAGLEAYAGPRHSVDADAIARAAARRLPLQRSILLFFTPGVAPAPRFAWRPTAVIALVAVLAIALAVSVVMVGNQPRRLPAVKPAGNGLIAYAHAGDIFAGDPSTGATTAIVSGPEIDSGPIFSPDGSHIAFVRGSPWTAGARLVVVRVDGSDERVITPPGFSDGNSWTYTWTPDSASLAVVNDNTPLITTHFGELSLFDASATAEPRLLTPPLPIGAPFAFSPDADLILSGPITKVEGGVAIPLRSEIDVWDADLEHRTVLRPAVPGGEAFEPFRVWPEAWSPDGSMIMFGVGGSSYGPVPTSIDGLYLMDADGSDVRRLQVPLRGRGPAWSPDGMKVAVEQCSADPDRPGAVIVIVDISSGTERALEATAVRTKTEGQLIARGNGDGYCAWFAGPEGRSWDYEGWSWSPDGRSIAMLERSGTRPMVVDVETGQARSLPWEADSAPSWQRKGPNQPG